MVQPQRPLPPPPAAGSWRHGPGLAAAHRLGVGSDRVGVPLGEPPPTSLAASATRGVCACRAPVRRQRAQHGGLHAPLASPPRPAAATHLRTARRRSWHQPRHDGRVRPNAQRVRGTPQERGAAGVAASPPSGSEATAPRYRADSGSTGTRTRVADRAGRHPKAGNGKHDRGRPADRGTGKPTRSNSTPADRSPPPRPRC
jgi:hypothetical protein